MTIEQYLMNNMKFQDGVTHGRGIGEGVLLRGVMGMTCVQYAS